MGLSMIDIQRDAIIRAIRGAGRGEWRVLVLDEESSRLVFNVLKEDQILAENIAYIEKIEQRRKTDRDTAATYLLTPEAHIVDCLMADFERRRYKAASLLWTALPHASLRERMDKSRHAKEQIIQFQVIDVGFYPRESNVVTFRDPYSFPVLYHPGCNGLVRQHLADLAQKIVSVCVSLGEYPVIRYYRPRVQTHDAAVMCSHLARLVQEEIDMYAQYHPDFPPPSQRPRAVLCILDRTVDLFAPLLHEFTYQAMIHDLLPLRDGDTVSYRMVVPNGDGREEEKDIEITEKDKLWIDNRHRHMKDTIEKLMGDFQKFIRDNPHFTNQDASNATNLNTIKDMLAGLPQFQEMKEAYSLHIAMAQDAMNRFEKRKLPDLASIEQSLATGLDEEQKRPKGLADQVIRTLDEEAVIQPDRLRLILMYVLYANGLLPADVQKLFAHAQLPAQDNEVLQNMAQLGTRVSKPLKDKTPAPPALFPVTPSPTSAQDSFLSRFEPNLKSMLAALHRGTLDQETFPYTKPQLEPQDGGAQATSLRSAKPTWARARTANADSKQRVIVFMAGGATYSESRACYEITNSTNKDVCLVTSHMMTPSLFLRQVGDLSVSKSRLKIPMDQPKPKAPAYLFEEDPPPQQQQQQKAPSLPQPPAPPTQQMGNMKLGPIQQSNGMPHSQKPAPPPDSEKKDKKKGGLLRKIKG